MLFVYRASSIEHVIQRSLLNLFCKAYRMSFVNILHPYHVLCWFFHPFDYETKWNCASRRNEWRHWYQTWRSSALLLFSQWISHSMKLNTEATCSWQPHGNQKSIIGATVIVEYVQNIIMDSIFLKLSTFRNRI